MKYPNYEKLAAYLNTFENPERILNTLVALCEPITKGREQHDEH